MSNQKLVMGVLILMILILYPQIIFGGIILMIIYVVLKSRVIVGSSHAERNQYIHNDDKYDDYNNNEIDELKRKLAELENRRY